MGDGIMLHRIMSAAPRFTFVPTDPNAAPGFTYINDGHGDWRIKFLTSGTLTFQSTLSHGIDVFLVGGGGEGIRKTLNPEDRRAGGGAGYTKTQKGVSVTRGTSYNIVVGQGGVEQVSTSGYAYAGGDTTAFGYTAYGGNKSKTGQKATRYTAHAYVTTGDTGRQWGGSGGSAGFANNDGKNGVGYTDGNPTTSSLYAQGQGSTTREFGEPDGYMYSHGGGSGIRGLPNTGDGGNATGTTKGSSGIVVIRNAR